MFLMNRECLAFCVKIALGFAGLPLTFRSDKQDKKSLLPNLRAVKSGSDEAWHSSLIKNKVSAQKRARSSIRPHTEIRWEEFQAAVWERVGQENYQGENEQEIVCVCA